MCPGAHMGYRIRSFLALLLLWVLPWLCLSSSAGAGDIQSTIESILAAYGGKQNILQVQTIAAQGRIDDFLRKSSGGYARTMRRHGDLRIDIMPERGGEVRILSKNKGFQGSGQTFRAASPLSTSSMRYQYGYLDLPMSLADGTAKVSEYGVDALRGRKMEILWIDLDDAPRLKVYIDFETHLIRRVEAKFLMGGMGSSILGTEYDNFKTIDGVVFPLKLLNFAGDNYISVITISRLTINKPIPDTTFSTPSH